MTTVDRILELVKESGLTAKEFAEGAGIAGGSITDWKTGRSRPSVESLQKIAKYTSVDVNWLIGISYFRNSIEHASAMGFCSGIIINLSNKECFMVESEVNKRLNQKISNDILMAPRCFLAISIESFHKLLEILYHDYIENRDLYRIIYGTLEFSIVSFLNYSALRFAKGDSKIQLKAKINELEGKSYLNEDTNMKENIKNFYMCPVYGRISAGQPNWAEECIEGRLPIDPELMNIANPEECFFLRVNGESMNKEIKNGAYALIRKADIVDDGDIAVVLVNGYDATLKKFSKQGDFVVLEPMSTDPSFKTQIYTKDTEIKILGKYIGKMEMK